MVLFLRSEKVSFWEKYYNLHIVLALSFLIFSQTHIASSLKSSLTGWNKTPFLTWFTLWIPAVFPALVSFNKVNHYDNYGITFCRTLKYTFCLKLQLTIFSLSQWHRKMQRVLDILFLLLATAISNKAFMWWFPAQCLQVHHVHSVEEIRLFLWTSNTGTKIL